MKKTRRIFEINFVGALLLATFIISCTSNVEVLQITTSPTDSWQLVENSHVSPQQSDTVLNFDIDTKQTCQEIDGFGACFNELGWTSLNLLSENDRNEILNELFTIGKGANFNICRMPVAANDFSRDWYSYNEVEGDFAMENFSIENDKETLIPFIHAALSCNSDLKIWASPWCPPTWMKYNKHYASSYNGDRPEKAYRNGLRKDQQGYEGTDMFIQEPRYMEAYANYFSKFVSAYKSEGINIFAVMPQNEFNSAQVFPSCCWKSSSLATFVGEYLGPKMHEKGVEVFFGTMERANAAMIDTVLTHEKAKEFVSAVGFQWAGKGAVGAVHEKYPDMKLYQTEQECGNGRNDWAGATHSWNLLKHYFDNGVSAYMYWNISLLEGGISRWGWAQNSLVVVDPQSKTYKFTPEYYLMKHISRFVKPGAHYVSVSDEFGGLVFRNPDNSLVVLYMEKQGANTTLSLAIDGEKSIDLHMTANTINTFVIKP